MASASGLAGVREVAGGGEGLDYSQLVNDLKKSVWEERVTFPYSYREQQLLNLRKGLEIRCDDCLEAVHSDLRKHPHEGFAGEVGAIIGHIDFCLANLKEWMQPISVPQPLILQPGSSKIVYQPKGVVLNICPWNYPISMAFNATVYALAAGNAVVIKPSEMTPASAQIIEEVVNQYLDPKCCRVVQGAVPETTALLREHWDHIFYTGNGAVGRIVSIAAAKHLTPVTLELGGKSPCYIDPSCNIDVSAARIVGSKMFNMGQTCVAPDYVLVHKDVQKKFVAALVAAADRMAGPEPKKNSSLARIVNERHWDRVMRLITSPHGGEVVFGGVEDGNNLTTADRVDKFITPTFILNPSPQSSLMEEEIFGPVLPIFTVESVDEAIRFINQRETPLALYIFTGDDKIQKHVVKRTKSGGCCVNDCIFHIANPGMPFGGNGASGHGKYHGLFGFQEFSHARSVMNRSTWLDNPKRYPPYEEGSVELLKKIVIGPLVPPYVKWLLASGAAAGGVLLLRARL